jgi:hypothetical protein
VDDLYQWIGKTGPTLVPGTLLARPLRMKNQERRWRRCFDDGATSLITASERQIRFVATGRKNFLFAGSDAGAREARRGMRWANCRASLGSIPEYLQDIIEARRTAG